MDQGGRYYNKTLDEYDSISLVRDRRRVGGGDEDEMDEDEDDEAERDGNEGDDGEGQADQDEEEYQEEEEEREEENYPDERQISRPDRSSHQLRLESEWGMYRSGDAGATASTTTSREGSVTRGSRLDSRDKEQYTVSSPFLGSLSPPRV